VDLGDLSLLSSKILFIMAVDSYKGQTSYLGWDIVANLHERLVM